MLALDPVVDLSLRLARRAQQDHDLGSVYLGWMLVLEVHLPFRSGVVEASNGHADALQAPAVTKVHTGSDHRSKCALSCKGQPGLTPGSAARARWRPHFLSDKDVFHHQLIY